MRWRNTLRPNITPQSITPDRVGEPGTFSITHGRPDAARASRHGPRRSGCLPALPWMLAATVYRWHGGLAWITSNSRPCAAKYSRASAWVNEAAPLAR